ECRRNSETPNGKWNSSTAKQRVWFRGFRLLSSFVIGHSDFIMSIADLRKSYHLAGLRRADLGADPIRQFQGWLQQAIDAELLETTAMKRATTEKAGRP